MPIHTVQQRKAQIEISYNFEIVPYNRYFRIKIHIQRYKHANSEYCISNVIKAGSENHRFCIICTH